MDTNQPPPADAGADSTENPMTPNPAPMNEPARPEPQKGPTAGVASSTAKPIGININKVHLFYPWSRTTTYLLVKSNRIPARKLGSSTIILTADLDRFVSELPEVAS